MANIRLIGKPGSKSCKDIRRECSILGYTGKKMKVLPDALVNYGLAGSAMDKFFKKFPSASRYPIVNRRVGYSKLTAVRMVEKQGIKVPDSKTSLSRLDKKDDWIEKKTNSIGGKGIRMARSKSRIDGKYYQKFIRDRRYELRVHAFGWLPKSDWPVQKRYGAAGEIAWNYKNGGHFVSVKNPGSYSVFVEARDIAEKVLNILNMSFGAADFLVTAGGEIYFIEINSAPGFSELSKPIYVSAFSALKGLSKKEVLKYAS